MSLAKGMSDWAKFLEELLSSPVEAEPGRPVRDVEAPKLIPAEMQAASKPIGAFHYLYDDYCGSLEEELHDKEFLDHAEDEDAD